MNDRNVVRITFRREAAVGLQRVALDGNQEVHRNRRHLEFSKAKRQLDHVAARFTHPEDEPTAGFDSELTSRLQCAHAVRVAVGGAHFPVVTQADCYLPGHQT